MSLLASYFSKIFCVGQHSLLNVIMFPMVVHACRFSIIAFVDSDSMNVIIFFISNDVFTLVSSVDVTICPTCIYIFLSLILSTGI